MEEIQTPSTIKIYQDSKKNKTGNIYIIRKAKKKKTRRVQVNKPIDISETTGEGMGEKKNTEEATNNTTTIDQG